MSNRSPTEPHALGVWGEHLAAAALERIGWRVLARNYRFGRREVDLVVCKRPPPEDRSARDTVAFVEVKTRAGPGFGHPEEALTRLKRREIEAVAAQYLVRHPMGDVDVRFDVVAIVLGAGRKVVRFTHVVDAWRPE